MQIHELELEGSNANTNLLCVILVSLVSFMGISMPYPMLAPLFMNPDLMPEFCCSAYSLSKEMLLGITLAVYPFGQFIGAPVLGLLSDRYGRKPLLCISMGMGGIVYLFSAIALVQQSLFWFIVTRLISGFWEGNMSVVRAVAADLSPLLDKSRTFGWINASATAGYIIGPILGGLILLQDQPMYHAPIILGGVISIICALILNIYFKETCPHPNPLQRRGNPMENGEQLDTIWDEIVHNLGLIMLIFKQPRFVVVLCLISALISLSFDTYYQFYPMLLYSKWGMEPIYIGLATSLLTVGMVFSQIFLIKPSENWARPEILIILLGLLYAILLAAMPLPEDGASILISFPILGLLIGIIGTHLPVYISNNTNPNHQGQIMGSVIAMRHLGDAVICIVGSFIASYSIELPFIFGGLFMLAGIGIFAVTIRNEAMPAY